MQRKKDVILFLVDGFADWEIAYCSVGIRKSQRYNIKTMALTREPVTSLGGMRVLPDTDFIPAVDLADMDRDTTAMLILPGSSLWEQSKGHQVRSLVRHCIEKGIPVAAICGATIVLADLGVLNFVAHTSNEQEYLKCFSPVYNGTDMYHAQPVVTDGKVITAGATASLDFARAIFEMLGIEDEEHVSLWFQYFNAPNEVD